MGWIDSLEEIQEALDACNKHDNQEVMLVKCCSQYPMQFEDMNLVTIPDLRERFEVEVGLSDHFLGSFGPLIATTLRAKVIEKYVCLNYDIETPDSGFSVSMDEFTQMVQNVRDMEEILGRTTYMS